MSIGNGGTARAALRLAVAFLFLGVLPRALSAQYFGRNQVQYETFDFRVLSTEHFRIHFYPEEREATLDASRMAERWFGRLAPIFQHRMTEVKPIVFYANHPDFQQTNIGGGGAIGEGTGAFVESLRTRLVMPFSSAYGETHHVLGHEMVHVYQYDLAQARSGMGVGALNRLPPWMVEGMAEYLSLGRNDPNTAMWMRDAALRGDLPSLDQLGRDPRYFPYRYGQALWAYIGGRWGDRAVTEIFRFALREGFDGALRRVTGLTPKALGEEWITSIRSTYLPLVEGRTRPGDVGEHVLGSNELGEYNMDPIVSPDGQYVAFFSRRGLFSIDLYLADAKTGKILKQLTSPTRGSHFDAIAFIYSAGSWSPDSKKFAFTVFADGDQQLAILDVASQDIERKISIEGVGEVTNPAWSPDGTQIALSGNSGGISNLYMLDLASSKVTQLTNDKYSDLQPAWSPDGRTIAFATDRGPSTDFTQLTFSDMQIGLYDVASQQIRVLSLFERGKHINPAFSPDGRSLFFISDREGISDVYRTDVSTGEVFQVTRVATGVSGITTLSPAMSVAQRTGRMMFAVFQNSGYNVYALEADRTVGTPVGKAVPEVAAAGILPPVGAYGTSVVVNYLEDAVSHLPQAPALAVADYKPKLRLDYLGQPSFGVGSNSFGTQVGGSASAFFSDMLSNHQLGVAVQAQGQVKDIGGQLFYQNTKRRLNWAVITGHVPYLSGYAGIYIDRLGSTPVQVVEQLLLRTYRDELTFQAAYPFSRTRRFEVSGGYTHLGYDYETKRFLYTIPGQFLGDSTAAFPKCDASTQIITFPPQCTPDGIHLASASAALVGDNSFFAFTSPIQGSRYRFEVAPTTGTLNFATATADYRTYRFKSPVTFALRGLHYGRYGKDSEDYRQQPLFLGYPFLMRGYQNGSFNGEECRDNTPNPVLGVTRDPCPVFNRLIGSRIAVANLELRIPLFGTEQFGIINFPFFPTEIAPFIDAGLAWCGGTSNDTSAQRCGGVGDSPSLRFDRDTGDRVPVFSAGITSRINVLGYLVLEIYYAYPFQRPDKGPHFGFQIQPGW
jgi:WD40 repeat protein